MGEPKDSGWVNLDADDGDDPLMVSEYVNEVFDYLKALEVSLVEAGGCFSTVES